MLLCLAATPVSGASSACGAAAKDVPRVQAAFVRRKEDYGMLWPGAIL